VSVGSTPTAFFAEDLSGVTEVRAGVFLFFDLVMAGLGVCRPQDVAVSVLSSVIGHQRRRGWAITDAGWMALSRDRGTASQAVDQGYGLVCDLAGELLPGLVVQATNQEHGIVADRSGKPVDLTALAIGSTVRILPNHACATAAMFDRYHVTDGSTEVVDVWHRINGW
jgi:D-serine deaminase-like pyridoxal phosphate-dependent protein